jgi:hypothetical protein
MIANKVIESLESNRGKRLRGDVIAIPWSLRRLSSLIPGVERSKYYLITASPKGGKTQLADFLFVIEPIEWYIRTKPKIKLKILYFSLEMSKESKILQAISYKLNKDYGISIAPQHLKSTFGNYVLDEKILRIIHSRDFQAWLSKFESLVTYIDDIRSPERIHRFVKGYAEKHGKYLEKDGIIEDYLPNDPDEHVIVVCDHLSLLSPDNGDTLHNAMYKYSAYHCLEFRDRFKYTVVNIQQQSADSSKQQFDYRGNSILEKIRPSPDGLADMRLSSRDVNLMISLFNPSSYNIEEHEGIDLRQIGNWHRELFINLNRDGLANASLQLYFNGAVNEFMELPRPMDETTYKLIANKTNKLIQ